MKNYILTGAQTATYQHPHPERTARRSAGWDFEFQVWTNREAMLKTCQMQDDGRPNPWRPLIPAWGFGNGKR